MRNAFTFIISVAFIAGLFKFVEPTLADFSWNFALATGGVSLVLTSGLNRLLTPAIQRNAVRDDDSATIGNSSLAARLSKLDAIHRLKLNPRWRFMRKWGLVRKSWGLLAGCLCLPVSGLASDGIFDRLPYMRPLDLLVIIGGSLFVYLELRRIDRLEDQLHCLRDQYIRHLELDRKGISETHGAAGMEKYVCNCGNEESIWSKCKRWLTGLKEKLLTRKVKSLIVLFGLLSTGIVETAYGQTVAMVQQSTDYNQQLLLVLGFLFSVGFVIWLVLKLVKDRSNEVVDSILLLRIRGFWRKEKIEIRREIYGNGKRKRIVRLIPMGILFACSLSSSLVPLAYGQTVESQIDRKGGTQELIDKSPPTYLEFKRMDAPSIWREGCIAVGFSRSISESQPMLNAVGNALDYWNKQNVPIHFAYLGNVSASRKMYGVQFTTMNPKDEDGIRTCGQTGLGNSRQLSVFNEGIHEIELSSSMDCRDSWFGVVLHELGHAVGLMHEHQRKDRDKYIEVKAQDETFRYKGQKDKWKQRYAKDNANWILQFRYDYHSIMHYSSHPYSHREGIFRLKDQPIDTPFISNTTGLSRGDIEKLRFLYRNVQKKMDKKGWKSPCENPMFQSKERRKPQ